jgi:hypothetical protein
LLAPSGRGLLQVADLGKPNEIGNLFTGFQKFLYQPVAGPT